MQRWMLQKHSRQKFYNDRRQGINKRFAIIDRKGVVAVPMPEPSNHDTITPVDDYLAKGGKVQRCKVTTVSKPREAYSVTGKRGAIAARRCYGDGHRSLGSKLVWSNDVTVRLIKAK